MASSAQFWDMPRITNAMFDAHCHTQLDTLAAESHQMFRQPDTRTITEKQLIDEVREIYTGLAKAEKKCIEIDAQQAHSKYEQSQDQWQTFVSLHRTLLYKHHDFLLTSQHPSAGPVLKDLALKYEMPARMWRYGVHSFLELLRQKPPGFMEHMLNFIHISYSMMTLLLESVPAFKETWIECLGDLARYRMAVEEFDKRDRELWAGVSRYWYNQHADQHPEHGRIQHHLAILARPDVLQQFFYYTKASISVRPFQVAASSAESLVTMCIWRPILVKSWGFVYSLWPRDRRTMIPIAILAQMGRARGTTWTLPIYIFQVRSQGEGGLS